MALPSEVAFEDVTAQFERIESLNYAISRLTTTIQGANRSINVAICRECKYVVLAASLANHLVSNKEHQQVRRNVNNIAKAAISALVGFLSSEAEVVAFQDALRSKNISQLPYLAISSGWQCHRCFRVYSSKDSLSSHRGRCSADTRPVGQRSHPKILDSDEIKCQTFFAARNRTLFKVQTVELLPVVSQEAELILKVLEDRLMVSDDATELQTPVPWLERTGWTNFCGGSKESVMEVCKLPRLDVDRDPHISVIQKATKLLLTSSLSYIERTGVQFLCKLKSPDEADDGRPFTRKFSAGALDDYFGIMARMVIYLCRIIQRDDLVDKCKVVFPETIRRGLLAIIEISAPLEGQEVEDQDLEVLAMSILSVIIDCMKTDIPVTTATRFDHPVLNYLATQGWDEKNKTWRDAEYCTKTFAGMSYCTRLLVLRQAWELARYRVDDDTAYLNVALKEELDLLLPITKEARGYPMSEWLSQHAYGKAISEHSSKIGKLHWNKDGTGIYYKGELFLIEGHRSYIKTIAPSLNAKLERQMFGENIRIKPMEISEDPSDSSRGYYCCRDPKNSEFFQPTFLLEKIESTPELLAKFFPSPGVLSMSASDKYLEEDMEIRKLFAIAALLTAGEPPRGTELSVVRKYNTGINSRNVYVIDGDVMLLYEYIKTQAQTGFSKPVARFFPGDIGELFLTYLMVVDPFCDYLRAKKSMKLTSYLFAGPDGIPWGTDVYSDYLMTHAQAVTGFPLKVSSYRQIIAGITRAYVDPMSQLIEQRVEEEENVAAEQFGHGRRTNLARYGRESHRFMHMNEVTMDLYRRATAFLQFFIGAIPSLPEWLIEPSKIYFVTGTHPRFRHPAYPGAFRGDPGSAPRPSLAIEGPVRAPPPYSADAGPAVSQSLPAASQGPVVTQTASAVTSNYYGIRDHFPKELHAVLYKQYSQIQPDGTMSRVQWKLPEQAQAAEAIYKRNMSPLLITLACAAGKTTAALLAIKAGNGISIIVEPYISTCDDVADRARAMGIHVTYWVSEIIGVNEEGQPVYRMRTPDYIDKSVPGVIIATPEAAISPNFLEEAVKLHVERRLDRIIVDEIHQPILDEGFRDVAALSKLTNLGLQLVCMSATTPPLMLGPICNFFHVSSFQEIRSTTNVRNMQYKVMIVGGRGDVITEVVTYIQALQAQFAALGVQPQKNKILAFCRSCAQVHELRGRLQAYTYEGKMDLGDRKQALEDWDRTGGVMCATTAFGPGVDAKNVVAVVHVGCPYTLVDLIQQSSRAGRDGSPAVNTVICRKPSFRDENYRNRQLWRRESYKALNTYITTDKCRRWAISSYMDGNDKVIDCVMGGMALCDNCDSERDPQYTAAVIANRAPALVSTDLPRLDRNAARAAQNASIAAFITACNADCAYCRFTLGCDSGHNINDCPIYGRPDSYPDWDDSVCTKCGMPTRVCMLVSTGERCKCHEACLVIYTAVFADPDIRLHVFGELGVRGLKLNDWYTYKFWLTEVEPHEEVGYSNAWRLLQTLEELNYLV
ncbi:hypothetical protein TWF281_003038 [Arthrobotrys megalospora]